MRLDGKIALIVGAGERMGRAVPLLFAQEGAKVVLMARGEERTRDTAARIRDGGGDAVYVQADATTAEGARAGVSRAVDTYGRLDILYNNAGGGYFRQGGGESLADMEESFWQQIIDNNLKSAYQCSKAALPEMLKNNGGVIINVSADYTVRQRGPVPYGAAKQGLIGFTQNLAREYHSQNIRVNCICPGLIRLPLRDGVIEPRREPLGRHGSPEDVAYAALYLASDEAAWLTGVVLLVDGGNEVTLLERRE